MKSLEVIIKIENGKLNVTNVTTGQSSSIEFDTSELTTEQILGEALECLYINGITD